MQFKKLFDCNLIHLMHVCITAYFRHAGYIVIWQMYNAFYTNQVPNWRCRKRDPDLDSIVPADATAPSNVMPSVGTVTNFKRFYPAALKGSGVLSYPERAGGRAAGQTSPVNTLTSIIFHGSFSNLARSFITIRSRTSSIMEVLPH